MKNIVFKIGAAGAIVLAGAMQVSAASATTVDFPNTDGSGDLSSADAWGGDLPATTEAVLLDRSYGMPLTFSESRTFDDLFFTTTRTTNTVEITDPSVVVTLTGAQDSYPGIGAIGSDMSYGSLTLKGGIYDLSGRGILSPASTYSRDSRARNYCQLVLDGATVTNAANVQISEGSFGGRLVVRNGSDIWTAKADGMTESLSDSYPKDSHAEFSGGSKMVAASAISPFGRGARHSTFLVTGEGTVLTGCSTSASTVFGSTCSNSFVRVEDRGELNLNSPHVGASGTSCCGLEVSGGGILRFLTSNDTYFPYASAAHHLSLKVLDDAAFTCGGQFYFGYNGSADDSIVISNGSFTVSQFNFGGTRGSVRVLGEKAVYAPGNSQLFGGGAVESTLEFGAGATWSASYPYLCSAGASSNTFAVVDGATVTVGNFNGHSYHGNSTFGYTVRIANGGKLCVTSSNSNWGNYYWTGWDNATVVSNGTLEVANKLSIGNAYQYVAAEEAMTDTHDAIVFQGTCPKVSCTGDSQISRGGIIRFEVPAEGYPTGSVLWTARMLYSGSGDPIVLQVTGVDDEFVKNLPEKFDATLISQTFRGSVRLRDYLADQVAAINATLPDRVRLYFDEGGYELHLAAKPYRGSVLILR